MESFSPQIHSHEISIQMPVWIEDIYEEIHYGHDKFNLGIYKFDTVNIIVLEIFISFKVCCIGSIENILEDDYYETVNLNSFDNNNIFVKNGAQINYNELKKNDLIHVVGHKKIWRTYDSFWN